MDTLGSRASFRACRIEHFQHQDESGAWLTPPSKDLKELFPEWRGR